MPETRSARLRAPAKINLTLEVLGKRSDGFHELRTVFQTVTLADTIEISVARARKSRIEIDSEPVIPDNLAVRAAETVLQLAGVNAVVTMRLRKRIPMGGGLGGGSSDAAAVLLGLPVLLGCFIPVGRLLEAAAQLGSDVPFFLLGGTAAGLGRGGDLYPLPDSGPTHVLIVAPGIHVSTPEAYRALRRPPLALTSASVSPKINNSPSLSFQLGAGVWPDEWATCCRNDFEAVVFESHPRLESLKNKLRSAGAEPALMTGSGSALFGVFPSRSQLDLAMRQFGDEKVHAARFLSRKQYRQLWWRQLREHIDQRSWPPRSRYAR